MGAAASGDAIRVLPGKRAELEAATPVSKRSVNGRSSNRAEPPAEPSPLRSARVKSSPIFQQLAEESVLELSVEKKEPDDPATPEAYLLDALKQGDRFRLKELLKNGTSANAKLPGRLEAVSPLLFSLRQQDQDAALLLLKHGADPNARSPEGDTPLLLAAQLGFTRVVSKLLDAGVDPRPPASEPPSRYPFVAACRNNHRDVCNLLLKASSCLLSKPTRALDGHGLVCHICERRVADQSFFQHLYLCLVQHLMMQEYAQIQDCFVQCTRLLMRGAGLSRELRKLGKTAVFATQREGLLTYSLGARPRGTTARQPRWFRLNSATLFYCRVAEDCEAPATERMLVEGCIPLSKIKAVVPTSDAAQLTFGLGMQEALDRLRRVRTATPKMSTACVQGPPTRQKLQRAHVAHASIRPPPARGVQCRAPPMAASLPVTPSTRRSPPSLS